MGHQRVILPNLLLETVSTKRSEQSVQGFSQPGLEKLQEFDVITLKINLILNSMTMSEYQYKDPRSF